MLLLALSVMTVLVVSAFCSLSEASIYAVRRPYIRGLVTAGSRAGPILDRFKANMDQPIAAILIVNTVANTAGAAVAGAQAAALFGGGSLLWFSAFFTLAVLVFSEIIPKVVGVVHNRPIARMVALPWSALIMVLKPLTALAGGVSEFLKPKAPVPAAPEDEVRELARMSAEEGSILDLEATIVANVLKIDEVTVRHIMTPRRVVFKLSDDARVGDLMDSVDQWEFSRIPVHDPEDPERWTGVVRTRDVLMALAKGEPEIRLRELAKPLSFVPEGKRGHELLERFLEARHHLFAVVDEFGGIAGVATLEDVLEALIGREIVDEIDRTPDLRDLARRRFGKGSNDEAS